MENCELGLNHIGIIMDGNRRWAKERGLDPKLGHKEGAKTVENIVRYANSIGLKYLTVYAFSTENWKRSKDEVDSIMKLLQTYLNDYSKRANTENVKIRILGDISKLKLNMQKSLKECEERTQNNTGITFNVALNYGGRDEIVNAVKRIIKIKNITENEITEELLSQNMYNIEIPDPDLIIRTGGELRLSNFLVWQNVYSELLFIDKYWPDFVNEDLDLAIKEYNRRIRKFGGN